MRRDNSIDSMNNWQVRINKGGVEGLAAGAAGFHELWGKMGVIYREKPTNFTNFHEFGIV